MGGACSRDAVLVAVGEPGQHVRLGGSARQGIEPALLPGGVGSAVQDVGVKLLHERRWVEAAIGMGKFRGAHEALRHLIDRGALAQLA